MMLTHFHKMIFSFTIMDVSFDLSTSLKEPVHRFDRNAMKWMNPVRNAGVRKAIDEMGKLSAQVKLI